MPGSTGRLALEGRTQMHIAATNTPDALRAAGKHVRHCHLADNTRQEPGTGDIDYVAGMKALLDIGFQGYMACECGISGPRPRRVAGEEPRLRARLDREGAGVAETDP